MPLTIHDNSSYDAIRKEYVSRYKEIIAFEKEQFEILLNALIEQYDSIEKDFNEASTLVKFWLRYPPQQRGYKPTEESFPWGEVGEKVLDAYLYKIFYTKFTNPRFIGLPYGHDSRFVSEDAFIQIDTKSTGPNDNPDEVVSSPNQVTGDGLFCDSHGVYNSPVEVIGPRAVLHFQPELPPFYVVDRKPRLTLTFYLKCVYSVVSKGNQPLHHLELICVPNGILMFDTMKYGSSKGLLTPGKDEVTAKHKRTRIKLDPLARIDKWRCVKIYRDASGQIKKSYR